VNIGSLSEKEFISAIQQEGVAFRVAGFVVKLQTPFADVGKCIYLLYFDFPLADLNSFIDFHMEIVPPKGVRRWYCPQVEFYFDGFRPFKPLPRDQAYAMFEWSFNWCVANHMHNYFIVHAAVVDKDDKCIIMPAPPGSGKSTLCASLVMSGWRLLSDELALLDLQSEHVYPIPRPINLKNNSIDIIRNRFSNAVFGPIIKDTAKGTVSHLKPPEGSVLSASRVSKPTWIIFPKYLAGSETSLLKRSKAQTFMEVAKNAFNYTVLGRDGFQTLVKLIDACDCYDFCYSNIDDALEEFDKLRESK